MSMTSATLRLKQIQIAAGGVRRLAKVPGGQPLIGAARSLPIIRRIYQALLGFHRPYRSLADAVSAIKPYRALGHERDGNTNHHLQTSTKPRSSDYPALFHIKEVLGSVNTVFDLGGSVGNLYYCYSKYLQFRDCTRWTILDLPKNVALGKIIAASREAHCLQFAESWLEASGVDLLLASGSMHYFERPLSQMVAELAVRPTYVLVNRTPLTEKDPIGAVQCNHGFVTACFLHNRAALIDEFRSLGYRLVDSWDVVDLSLSIVGFPEYNIYSYSGLFFELTRPTTSLGSLSRPEQIC